MTSGQKIAFSLLTAMILFAGFFVVSQSGLFTELETRYYSQAKIREKVDSLDNISEGLDSYITNFLTKTKTNQNDKDAFLNSSAVISYVDANNPSEEYVSERRRLTEELFTQFPALKGFRIIDKNGRNVHYSSFDSTDILRQSGITKYYKFYSDIVKDADELDFSSIAVNEETQLDRILIDTGKKRLIISMPLKLRGVFQASVVFYFDIHEIQEELIDSEILSLGQNLCAFSDDLNEGFAINVPVKYYDDFSSPILESWKTPKEKFDDELLVQPEKILEIDDGRFWVLLTSSASKYFKVSGVYTSDIFELSKDIKYLIYIAVGISLFLITFLCFSFKTDKKVVIKKRIKKIQYEIISEYLDNKEKIEWSMVVNQLKAQKEDLSAEILKSAGVKSKKKAEKLKLDEFLEQSWEQIFAVIAPEIQEKKVENKYVPSTPNPNTVNGITLDQLRSVIEEVLKDTKLNVQVNNISGAIKTPAKKVAKPVSPVVDDVEEVEEVEELADDVEEIEEIEELPEDAEEVEEVEELADDVEEVEEVEELAEDVEEIEEIEELPDDVEEVEEVEELADDAEEVEEIEEIPEDAEEIEEVEEIADDVEEIEEVEEIADDAEEIEEVEELPEDAEEVEEVEEIADDAEEIEEVEELADDAEEIEEVEELPEDVEEVEEVEELPEDTTEELATGPEYTKLAEVAEILDIKVEKYTYKPTPIEDNSEVLVDELEEIDDSEMFITNDYFAMTQFGANTNNIQELEDASDSIVEDEEGVFTVADDLEYSKVTVNQDFKKLVESVTSNTAASTEQKDKSSYTN